MYLEIINTLLTIVMIPLSTAVLHSAWETIKTDPPVWWSERKIRKQGEVAEKELDEVANQPGSLLAKQYPPSYFVTSLPSKRSSSKDNTIYAQAETSIPINAAVHIAPEKKKKSKAKKKVQKKATKNPTKKKVGPKKKSEAKKSGAKK